MFRCDFGFVRSGDKGSSCIKDKRYLTIGDTGQKPWRKWCYYEISSIDVSCRARGGLSHTWGAYFFPRANVFFGAKEFIWGKH